jgi:predicted transcriptional regulator
MTVLTRLWEKGYLLRQRSGRAYLYEARAADEIAGTVGGRAVREAIERFGAHAIVGFAQGLTPEQRQAIVRTLQEDSKHGTP